MQSEALVMPEWAIWLIGLGLTWLMTQGIKSLSRAIPWLPSVEGQSTALVAAAVALIITVFNAGMATLPPEWVPLVDATFKFVAMLLSAYGVQHTLKSAGTLMR